MLFDVKDIRLESSGRVEERKLKKVGIPSFLKEDGKLISSLH
jgi:hypothetical protein